MVAPKLTLGGVEYTAEPIKKMKLWRKAVKLSMEIANMDTIKMVTNDEMMYQVYDLIVIAFNNPNITREMLDNEMDPGDFIPIFQDLSTWVISSINKKLNEIPAKNANMTAPS
jgi:hypothetical protein